MRFALMLITGFFLTTNAIANDEFKAEMSTLCDKTKSCSNR